MIMIMRLLFVVEAPMQMPNDPSDEDGEGMDHGKAESDNDDNDQPLNDPG